jgi:hypothetical protein
MRWRLAMCGAFLLVVVAGWSGAAAGLAGQSAPPKQGTDITVTNSPNSVAAGTINEVNTDQLNAAQMNIGQMHVYQMARRDPVTQEFVASLLGYNRRMSQTLQQSRGFSNYSFVLDDSAFSRFATASGNALYYIIAMDVEEELGPRIDRCEFDSGLTVVGMVGSGSRADTTGRLRMRLLTRDDGPLLQNICRGLRLRLSALRPAGSRGPESDLTVLDYLLGDHQGLGIVLWPGRFSGETIETSLIRDYWMAALQLRYSRMPELSSDPGFVDQAQGAGEGEWIDLEVPLPPGFDNVHAYPARAREEFGARVDRLDADWMAYLARSAMTIRNQRIALFHDGHLAQVLPRFLPSQVGSPAFWLAARDMRTLTEQMDCIAQHFLSERQYVSPEESPYMGECAIDEIRLPAR